MNAFQFSDTTATQRIFGLTKRIRAVAGGTAASKTISILVWLIDYCQSNDNKVVDVVSESFPHLSKGAMLDFENIMKAQKYWKDGRWNRTNHIYTFETGSKLSFISVDTYGKAHGPRRDVLFVNEANNLDYNIVDQLIVRTRETVWLDWNPTTEFWFYTDMLHSGREIDFITLTYLDNEALDANTISDIESHKNNKSWWQVYGLGQLGELEEKIYSGWGIVESIPHEARLERYGLDFGFTNDPSVLVAIYRYNNGYIIDEVCYLKGMSNKSIADIILAHQKEISQSALVVADSSEPKSIEEIKQYGVSIVGAVKGQGSVMQGIQYVQTQRISLTSRSVKTIKAYRNYVFIKDKNGKVINEPDDSIHEWSNSMDAIRYGVSSMMQAQVQYHNPHAWDSMPVL